MTVDEAIICLSDMKIKIAIPKAAVQARLNNDALNMAIEALRCSEIPNNSDTISRQAAIDEAEKWFFNLKDKRTIGEVLKGLPSEQPETNCSEIPNNWIPCSERLPEDNTRVQVTFANGEVGQSSWHKENEYNNGFDAVMHGVTDRHFVTFGVIAWMPLPEPYQGKSEDKE